MSVAVFYVSFVVVTVIIVLLQDYLDLLTTY